MLKESVIIPYSILGSLITSSLLILKTEDSVLKILYRIKNKKDDTKNIFKKFFMSAI